MKIRKRKQAREEREFLINHARQLAKVITTLEPYACEGACQDHLMWSCEAEASHYDGTVTNHIVMAGALYPDGGWTAHIIEREDPTYQERMAFVLPHNTLLWEFNDERETIVLEFDEAVSLMAGAIPDH